MSGMNMTVGIYEVEITAHIGLLPQEKVIDQAYRITAEVEYNPAALMCSPDNIGGTISYVEIFDIISKVFAEGADLLETVAMKAAKNLTARFPQIQKGHIDILKLNPPIPGIAGNAGVKYFFQF